MPGTERAVQINWSWGVRPLRLMVMAVAIVLFGFIHGVGLAARETVRTVLLGLLRCAREAGRGQWLSALWALVSGLLQMVVAWPAPLFSNFLVGLGAALELCRQALTMTDNDQHFEMLLGGDASMSFLARCGDLFTRAEVVRVSEPTLEAAAPSGGWRCYPVIESVEVVAPSYLDDEDECLDFLDTQAGSMTPLPFVGGLQRPVQGELAAANVVNGLRRFADY